MKQFVLGSLVAVALILGTGVGAVRADPTNHPRAAPLIVECGGVEYTVVGPGAAGLVAGSTTVFVATLFEGIDTFIDPSTGEAVSVPFSFSIGGGERTGQQEALTQCTFEETFIDPVLGEVYSVGTVTFFKAPRGGK